MRESVSILLGLFLLISCAPRKEVIIVKEKPSESTLELQSSTEDTTPPDTTTYFKFIPDTTEQSRSMPEISTTDTLESTKHQGYRVQIFAFSSKERAENAKKEAEQILSLPVYIEYDPSIDGPYKVRVGDFLLREEAERYKEKLRQEGYPDAFIVETQINK